jgi:hypothetical protein
VATTPAQLEFVQEVFASSVGDQVPNAGVGNLILFADGGVWYSKNSSGAVAALSGVTSVAAADATITIGGTTAAPTVARSAIIGDVSIAAGTNTATLASVITAAGPIGSGSTVPVISYDAKGRLTAVTTATITPAAIGAPSGSGTSSGSNTGDQTITLTGDVTGSGTGSFVTTLATTGVGAGGPTGSASTVPVITYDAKGRLTAVSTATITPAAIGAPSGSGTSSGSNSGDVTLGAVGSTPNANGASLVGQVLTLQPASATLAGLMPASNFAFIAAIDGGQFLNVQSNPYSNLKCDGATDDTAALNTLLSNAPDGSTLMWPTTDAVMILTGAVSIPAGKHFNFIGGAKGKTTFVQTSPTADHITCGDWYSTFTGISFVTVNTTTTGTQSLTSGTVLIVAAIPYLTYVAASGTITVNSSSGWQTLTYSARTSTSVTLSQTGTGTTVAGAPLVFKTAGAAINAGNNVGIDTTHCDLTCCYNGYVASGSTANASDIYDLGGLNTINSDIIINGANWNGTINRITVDCTVNSRTAAHVDLQQCGAVTGSDNEIIRGNYNLRMGYGGAAYPAGVFSVYFTDSFFDNAGVDAVLITGTAAVQRIKFSNSWLSSAQLGMGLNLASTATTLPTDIELLNCNIYANATNGVGGAGAQDIRILGCQIAGNATAGVNTSAARIDVANSRIGPVGGIGANGTGIIVPAGAYQYIQIHDNDISGNTTAPITDNSTSSVAKLIYGNAGMPLPPTPSIAASAAISTTETYITTAIPLPPGTPLVGTTYRLTGYGTCTSTAANVSTFTVRIGTTGTTPASDTTATAALAPATAAATSGTANGFRFEILVTCRVLGATTSWECSLAIVNTGVIGILSIASAAVVGVSTGAYSNATQQYLNVSYKTAATTTTSTFQMAAWETIKQ